MEGKIKGECLICATEAELDRDGLCVTCKDRRLEYSVSNELHWQIVEYARKNPEKTTREIADKFYVSDSTAKRYKPTAAEMVTYYRNKYEKDERKIALLEAKVKRIGEEKDALMDTLIKLSKGGEHD